ncbi:phenylalanine--tRNA ligase subunit beta, partial [Candidatus Saccharibacteria bacterium]|nr:phenylalanine--tRNA ligase subunit beta [Candidatus Saccharibacteria bacterium]
MKVSVENIRFFNKLNKTGDDPMPKGIEALVEKINTQLGGVDEVTDLSKKYRGVLVVKVVECIKHPNADKLSLCKIDDGGTDKKVKRDKDGLVQVVCGAPNVKAGMLAAWIPPGVTVPSTVDKDPFVLEARELRGEISNGMLASASELGISNDHSGIVELGLDMKAEPGQAFADVYKLNDYIIDIENKMFTHRPDLFGLMGIARELAGIQGQKFVSPEWYLKPKKIEASSELALEVDNQIPDLAPRFTAVAISDIQIGPSPLWLQINLMRVGIKPINNIVDITNYLMMVTAQPLHAYDYDKVKALGGSKLIVRKAKKGEKIKVLGGKEVSLLDSDIVIASPKEAIGIGGVIGGASTEVDATTKNIILECANFNMYSIRRTSMSHGLFTDASTRFTKGQSPLQCDGVITKTVDDILRLCGGKVASKLIDKSSLPVSADDRPKLRVSVSGVNNLLGTRIEDHAMADILRNVEFELDTNNKELNITVP